MKLATWNLERGETRLMRAEQEAILLDVNADIAVLTEPGPAYQNGPRTVTSPAERRGARGPESWIAIVGQGVESVELEIPYAHLAAAARVTVDLRTFIVYGAVLPWLAVTAHAPELLLPGETASAAFRRVLAEQLTDIAHLRDRFGLPTIWAGDFNQSLFGPVSGCSKAGREVLAGALVHHGLVAWNATEEHAQPGLCTIDLICGTHDLVPTAVGRIDPVRNEVQASDHAGYWVQL